MSGAVITRSHVGARPMTVSPSLSWWARGIAPSMKVSLYTRRSVLGLDEPLQGQSGPSLETRRDPPNRAILPAASSSTRLTRSESFVCNPNQFLPPLRKPKAPLSTFMASAGPLGEFQSGCLELEYVTPTTSSIGIEYNALPFFSFSVTVTIPSATRNVESRYRRLSPSVWAACASE